MKRTNTILFGALLLASTSFGQTINLNLNHVFDGTTFAYNQDYLTEDGKAVNFTRVQYYLSDVEITHDGGQHTMLTDPFVLASGNVTSYTIGNATATSIEGIDFNFGVGYTENHMGLGSWSPGHPLAAQTPSMDWGWPAGYFFFTINGKVDDNGDGIPNKVFELHGLGDALLREVSISGQSITNNTIDMYVNIADWIRDINLATVAIQHNAGTANTDLANNTNDETVFTMELEASTDEVAAPVSHISADYEMPYAPTLYYDLATTNNVDITIYDMSGAIVLKSENMNPEGNFFIKKELLSGTYIAVFANGELEENFRFIVQR